MAPSMPPPPYTPTPAELATLRSALDADPSIHARLVRSGEPGLDPAGWCDASLTRWLVAEGGDGKAAAARLAAHASWRAGILPDGWTAEKEALIAAELAQGKTFAVPPPPTTTAGAPARPLLLSISARHLRARRSPPAVGELSLLFAMDAVATAASAAADPAHPGGGGGGASAKGDGRVVSVLDMRGVGLANLDGDTSKAVVRVAQAAYPERLAATVIYGAPAIFSTIWAVLGRLLAPASLGKVFFLPAGGDWGAPALRAAGVDAAAIPACLGGGGGGGGRAVRAVPIQAFARDVGLGPRGGPVVPLEAGLVEVVGDPMVDGVGGRKGDGVGAGGGGVVVAARAA